MTGRKLIDRQRDTGDRRYVTTKITDEGLKILKDLDEPVANLHRRQMSRLGMKGIQELINLLERVRDIHE